MGLRLKMNRKKAWGSFGLDTGLYFILEREARGGCCAERIQNRRRLETHVETKRKAQIPTERLKY